MMRRICGAALIACLCSGAWVANAAPGDDKTAAPAPAPAANKNAGHDPKGSAQHLSLGQRAFDDDDYVNAVKELSLSMEAKPNAKAAELLGLAHLKLEQFDEARAAWKDALALHKRPADRAKVQKFIKDISSISLAQLRIDSEPAGATVFLGMKAAGPRGKTPLELSVRPGKHRVILALDNYDDAVALPDPVAIAGQPAAVLVTLRPKGCDVTLRSTTPRVSASVDGGPYFALPSTPRVTTGVHHITFSGELLESRTEDVTCADLKPLALDETLAKLKDGKLIIYTQPGWQVLVDDKELTVDREREELLVQPGRHRVVVKEAGKTPWKAEVKIASQQEMEVHPTPEVGQKGETGIEINPVPEDAQCYLDGVPQKARQFRVLNVAGKHVVDVRARGYQHYTRVVDVPEGDRFQEDARLERHSKLPLAFGIGATAVMAAGAVAGILGHYEAAREPPGAGQGPTWNLVEKVGWSAMGAGGAAAIALFAVQGILNRRGDEPPAPPTAPRLSLMGSFVPHPGGGALVLSGAF